jgi:hypothetical protein
MNETLFERSPEERKKEKKKKKKNLGQLKQTSSCVKLEPPRYLPK